MYIMYICIYIETVFDSNVLHLEVKIIKKLFWGTLIVLRYYKIDSVSLKC